MIERCKSDEKYLRNGITVCERWQIFDNFLEDMGTRPSGTSLDRKNGRLGYVPDNCRWATPTEQRKNQIAPSGNRARYQPVSSEQFEKIYSLRNDGRTYREISEELNLPINIVGRICRGDRVE